MQFKPRDQPTKKLDSASRDEKRTALPSTLIATLRDRGITAVGKEFRLTRETTY